VQRAVALPECATSPAEVYELAKRRGMNFVTITDHDTIAGVMQIADRPDVFVSEELTCWFPGEPHAVHVLCFGITPDDHDWLQAHSRDVLACAEYLHQAGIACALAHPFFHVAEPLTAAHRRTLARLFPAWETRNGSRARELNAPAAVYIETHGGVAVGGSDDHAGADVGRTYTRAPAAAGVEEFLEHIRAGRIEPGGHEGSPAKLAHSAIVLAARALWGLPGSRAGGVHAAPDPRRVLELAERVMREGQARQGVAARGLGPDDARQLLLAWLREMGLEPRLEGLLELVQADEFRHSVLERRARRVHERRLGEAAARLVSARAEELARAASELFAACLPAVPYLPAAAFLSRERAKLTAEAADPRRVAVIADGIGSVHGVARTLTQLREGGIDGYEIDVIGTDASVDRRLAAATELELPHYPGLRIGVPSLFALAEALTERPYDLVHVCAPGPAGVGGALLARIMGVPLVGSYHTELQAYAWQRSDERELEHVVRAVVGAFYRHCDLVLAPTPTAGVSLEQLGVPSTRLARWGRGVDTERFSPSLRSGGLLSGQFNVLYVGRLSREKGLDLLAEAFQISRQRDPRLHLTLVGRGPEEQELRDRLGDSATFLGWLEGEELARVYASADIFLFASTTDTFGQVILEAQASGLPVLAVNAGGPTDLIEDGRTGCLVSADPEPLADALGYLARREVLRRRLAAQALAEAEKMTWARSMQELAAGYARALGAPRGAAIEEATPAPDSSRRAA
jgi:glycosyltransferase involved in cell wall biosynthesis